MEKENWEKKKKARQWKSNETTYEHMIFVRKNRISWKILVRVCCVCVYGALQWEQERTIETVNDL